MKVIPYNKRESGDSKKAFASTKKTVKPVAKDTNKTRRKMVKPTKGAGIIKRVKPISNLKRDMKRPIR